MLKAVIDECDGNVKQFEKLNILSAVLDKHREVSIQEAVYRILSLPMTKSSVKVKYLSTIHPHFRDGLLKGKIEEIGEDESVFHSILKIGLRKVMKEMLNMIKLKSCQIIGKS